MAGSGGEGAILAAHDRLCAMLSGRPFAGRAVETCGTGFAFLGPEPADMACSPGELAALLTSVRTRPYDLHFQWKTRSVLRSRNVAWLVAEGALVLTGLHLVERRRYVMIAVLEKEQGRWHWRHAEAFERLEDFAPAEPGDVAERIAAEFLAESLAPEPLAAEPLPEPAPVAG